MPFRRQQFIVKVIEATGGSLRSYDYPTRSQAMRAAETFRATLTPKQGGNVTVLSPEDKVLQSWIENPIGPYFTEPGGFTT